MDKQIGGKNMNCADFTIQTYDVHWYNEIWRLANQVILLDTSLAL